MSNELSGIVYVNGEFMDANEAKVSAFDRGFIFGDGIYEVVPIVAGKLVDRKNFWERFERSLAQIELEIPLTHDEYEKMFYELIEKNNIKEGAVYTQVTRGVAMRDFDFIQNAKPTCFAFAYQKDIFNNPYAKTGIEIVSVEDIRWKRRDIKSVSLLGQCIAKHEAHKKGAFECFMVENGLVTEGSSSTAFIIKDGVLITKPLSNEILPGIRRKVILGFASDAGLKVEERAFSMQEVYGADEAFISAATLMLLPIIKADGKPINGGKVGKFVPILRDMYAAHLKKEAGVL
ncbi:D-amino acid aminotransferase [Campylobacter geochelonis]|uniref:branched-chain-amino-acid transaminase n=1 Tax=Campylobacter geochelonis TaxID=1780362 RepID=A0A128EG84_9BACT|nr:D-amino acid aminotransferase [Campylobacter geochelonis]QKF71516.1 D-amino acid aminotransferase [Campylobacter geochelonis]CZE47925.1 D-alanine aminotransferase [Campylobacter geochelonis]CZE48468.1 D-alanine aminotransferase [Campylobacter geochelonis]CZE50800.1 D-alanine aminotransferase [Campylobacter geochelonis]